MSRLELESLFRWIWTQTETEKPGLGLHGSALGLEFSGLRLGVTETWKVHHQVLF